MDIFKRISVGLEEVVARLQDNAPSLAGTVSAGFREDLGMRSRKSPSQILRKSKCGVPHVLLALKLGNDKKRKIS